MCNFYRHHCRLYLLEIKFSRVIQQQLNDFAWTHNAIVFLFIDDQIRSASPGILDGTLGFAHTKVLVWSGGLDDEAAAAVATEQALKAYGDVCCKISNRMYRSKAVR